MASFFGARNVVGLENAKNEEVWSLTFAISKVGIP